MARGSFGCLKNTLAYANAVFIVCAFGMIGVGVWGTQDSSAQFGTGSFAALTIAAGAALLAISVLGVIGGFLESRCLLCVYVVLVTAIIGCQLAMGVVAYKYRAKATSILEDGWSNAPANERIALQNQEGCCGFEGPSEATADVPCPSCKKVDTEPCPPSGGWPGCEDVLIKEYKDKLVAFAMVGICLAIVEMVGLVASVCLVCCIPADSVKEERLLSAAAKLGEQGWEAERNNPPRGYGT